MNLIIFALFHWLKINILSLATIIAGCNHQQHTIILLFVKGKLFRKQQELDKLDCNILLFLSAKAKI
jgi:hypothetical protein